MIGWSCYVVHICNWSFTFLDFEKYKCDIMLKEWNNFARLYSSQPFITQLCTHNNFMINYCNTKTRELFVKRTNTLPKSVTTGWLVTESLDNKQIV